MEEETSAKHIPLTYNSMWLYRKKSLRFKFKVSRSFRPFFSDRCSEFHLEDVYV